MQSTPLLSSLQGPLWPRVVAVGMVQSTDQIILNCVLLLSWIVWNRTVLTYNWTVLIFNWTVSKTILILN